MIRVIARITYWGHWVLLNTGCPTFAIWWWRFWVRVAIGLGRLGIPFRLLFIALLIVGCAESVSPEAPPASYRVLWEEAESCSGLKGDFTQWRWVFTTAIPGSAGIDYRNRLIMVRPGARDADGFVLHEMLHALQFATSDTSNFSPRGHPPELAVKCPRVMFWED